MKSTYKPYTKDQHKQYWHRADLERPSRYPRERVALWVCPPTEDDDKVGVAFYNAKAGRFEDVHGNNIEEDYPAGTLFYWALEEDAVQYIKEGYAAGRWHNALEEMPDTDREECIVLAHVLQPEETLTSIAYMDNIFYEKYASQWAKSLEGIATLYWTSPYEFKMNVRLDADE